MGVLDQPIQSESNYFCCSTSQNTYDASFVQQQDARNEGKKRNRHENDALISEAMQGLSFEEREELEEVLHGVDKDISEGAAFIENALQELGSHLKPHRVLGSAYELAERINPNYVHARPFRIMFLRGNRYDAKTTAEQMLKHFEMKKQIFGIEKLTKEITIDDLDQDDISALQSGMSQFCGRDRSGRMILIQLPSLQSFKNVKSEMRARYFFLMNALRSEQTQLKGFVVITYTVSEYKNLQHGHRLGFPEIADVTLKCPMFYAAVHFCCDDLREYFVTNLVLKAMPVKLRARVRLHYGSHLEIQYRLATFGIKKDQMPFIPGTFLVNRERHRRWFDQSCFGDNKSSIDTAVATRNKADFIKPHANDVLYMGGNRSDNAGNVHLRNLVAEWLETYYSGNNEAKRRVVNAIIDEIHKTGGRFLDQRDRLQEVWTLLPIERVRLKITQSFRNRRRLVSGSRTKRN